MTSASSKKTAADKPYTVTVHAAGLTVEQKFATKKQADAYVDKLYATDPDKYPGALKGRTVIYAETKGNTLQYGGDDFALPKLKSRSKSKKTSAKKSTAKKSTQSNKYPVMPQYECRTSGKKSTSKPRQSQDTYCDGYDAIDWQKYKTKAKTSTKNAGAKVKSSASKTKAKLKSAGRKTSASKNTAKKSSSAGREYDTRPAAGAGQVNRNARKRKVSEDWEPESKYRHPRDSNKKRTSASRADAMKTDRADRTKQDSGSSDSRRRKGSTAPLIRSW